MRAIIAVVVAFFALIASALALDFPPLTGRVVDDAGILDAAVKAALTQKLAALETRTTDQLVVVTLKSLQGTTVEDFGYQLGRRWGIGQKQKNNGVLLIVAPVERKVRFEVGYGLEGTLTDAATRLIIQNAILPKFRAGDFPGGIARGVDDVVALLTGDAPRSAQPAVSRPPGSAENDGWVPLVLLFVFGIALVVILANVMRGGGRRAGANAGYLPGSWASSSGASSWSSGSSGSFDSGFSGGGGSFGGGGSSGSW
jgi:uncharacterized protein